MNELDPIAQRLLALEDENERLRELAGRALLALDEDDFPQLRQDLRDALGVD